MKTTEYDIMIGRVWLDSPIMVGLKLGGWSEIQTPKSYGALYVNPLNDQSLSNKGNLKGGMSLKGLFPNLAFLDGPSVSLLFAGTGPLSH